jgi:hypothetical protein
MTRKPAPTAEASGAFADALEQAAEHLEAKVAACVEQLTSWREASGYDSAAAFSNVTRAHNDALLHINMLGQYFIERIERFRFVTKATVSAAMAASKEEGSRAFNSDKIESCWASVEHAVSDVVDVDQSKKRDASFVASQLSTITALVKSQLQQQ